LRNNILESNCDIVCIQETKKESFDDPYIRLFCNHHLDKFALGPSIGASRNRNKQGGDPIRMLNLNAAISQLGLQEIPLRG
jgi:hypothetical protein